MQDLNDMLFFAEVVDRGGFAAAGRALNLPKSKLSRRVAGLEARLGVRLLQRTTRKLSLTRPARSTTATASPCASRPRPPTRRWRWCRTSRAAPCG
jgi:DNA-binding transcriptional LysR family regulator